MARFTLAELAQAVDDPKQEGDLYKEVEDLRARIESGQVALNHPCQLERAHEALSSVLVKIVSHRDPMQMEPGHGPGHWLRDYCHAIMLASDPEMDPGHRFACLLGGMLHDVGVLFVRRYEDKNRALRHAEVGALLVRQAALETHALTPDEADAVAYVIAAHTHYTAASSVLCRDGVTRQVRPYVDMNGDKPVYEVWLSRMIDRLDLSGPCMVGRHFFTLAHDHEQYDNTNGFYKVSFGEHLRPLFRTLEQIKAEKLSMAMTEHLRMYAMSQTSESPYGKHDRGLMLRMRDTYRRSLLHILSQVEHPCFVDESRVMVAWEVLLGSHIEPTKSGDEVAESLLRNFTRLDPTTRHAWANGFRAVTTEYVVWADRMMAFIDRPDLRRYHEIPGLFKDVRHIIKPTTALLTRL